MASTSHRYREAVALGVAGILSCAIALAARSNAKETGAEIVRKSVLWWVAYSPDFEPRDLPADVQEAFREFRARTRSYRSRLRPPTDPDFPVQAAFKKKQDLERTVHGLFPVRQIGSVAAEFAERVSPAYEWEGYSGGPLTEINGAERFLASYPKTPIRSYALLLIAHRSICALDALEYELKSQHGAPEQNVAEQTRLRHLSSKALEAATLSQHPLIRFIGEDLTRRPRCLSEN